MALLLALANNAAAQSQTQPQAQIRGAAQWWLGILDTRGHAFLEVPADARACAARAALLRDKVRDKAAAAGAVLTGPLKAEAYVPPGARLLFGVTDLRGQYAERVFTRVAAIAREDERMQGACWYLAEVGTEAADYKAEEESIAFATLPPRRLALRLAANDWRAYGETTPEAANDGRFAAMDGAPAQWRARMNALLPGHTQVYGQSFSAILEKGGTPQALTLMGAINDGPALAGKGEAYNTASLILRGTQELYLSGPSGGVANNRAGSFVAQAVAALDLDGDGVDEIVLRARYFAGGNLKVLKLVGGRLVEIRQSAYEGE